MRGPNGVVVATAGAGAFAATPHCTHRQAKRRWRMTCGLTGGISISSYSPIKSFWASDGKAKPHCSQTLGMGIAKFVRIIRQPTVVRLMPEFRSARTRILALLLLVRRRRLGRRARSLAGPLEPQHQLDQLLFAQLLQITAIHRAMDSEIAPHGKGVGNCADFCIRGQDALRRPQFRSPERGADLPG